MRAVLAQFKSTQNGLRFFAGLNPKRVQIIPHLLAQIRFATHYNSASSSEPQIERNDLHFVACTLVLQATYTVTHIRKGFRPVSICNRLHIRVFMDEGESILGAIYEDDNLEEDVEDVEMLDIEEGELVEHNSSSQTNLEQNRGGDVNVGNQESQNKTRKRRANKKKNKKKKTGPGQAFTDINRFVLDTCRRLKEKKSYMVYTAVGCLGISALSDLVKEVDAIQSCGGQMTADGKRYRTGAYKQFRQQNNKRTPEQINEDSQRVACAPSDGIRATIPDGSQLVPQNQQEQSSAEGNRKSVHERIRVPVSYDDLLGEDPKNDSA
ncbi:hypothetical protein EZV62_013301 [Acer yangbiense]|uniref:Phosphorylated adapter RNA export protein n=1 Tax=Acer yangbiense TaxID=1000413 RepID=A0A5C7HYS8_9ROSI|nr:hypothetical protein EZV62_013301 [Acer yangbiense]